MQLYIIGQNLRHKGVHETTVKKKNKRYIDATSISFEVTVKKVTHAEKGYEN